MTTYLTLIPLSDLLQRGEAILPGELIGFDSAEGAQWCYYSHINAGIVCLRILPDADSENDPAMLAEHCFVQRPAVLVTDVVAMLQENQSSLINQLQAHS
ncbi:hypothetical protein [Spirosoma flavum]|uniref:Uncharacterized protein n=1 Tax=Spirosoma flavum TaxID=2048557 RepID=A0ABW6ABP3_9BACT